MPFAASSNTRHPYNFQDNGSVAATEQIKSQRARLTSTGPKHVTSTAIGSHNISDCLEEPCMFLFDEEYQMWNNRKPATVFNMRPTRITQTRRPFHSADVSKRVEGKQAYCEKSVAP